MKKRGSFFALLAVAFVAALFAVPTTAQAGAYQLHQSDFTDSSGNIKCYDLNPGWAYELAEDVQGAVYISSLSTPRQSASINLNGHTITAPASLGSAVVSANNKITLKITNGNLVQENTSLPVVTTGVKNGLNTTPIVNLDLGDGHSCTSNGYPCIDPSKGVVYANSGLYVLNNSTGSSSSLLTTGKGTIYVNGGYFRVKNETDRIAASGSNVTLLGGTYFSYPANAAHVGDYDNDMSLCYDGSWYGVSDKYTVKYTDTAKKTYNYCVTGVPTFGNVYFNDLTNAQKFLADKGGSAVEALFFDITFVTNNDAGDRIIKSPVHYGDKINDVAPSYGTKKGYYFLGWKAEGSSDYIDLESAVTSNLTLNGQWAKTVATIGDVHYFSLADAVADAVEGDTVKLEADTIESISLGEGAGFTIDLNGHTLAAQSGKAGIELTGKRSLTVINGTILGNKLDCILLKKGSDGSVLTLGDTKTDLALEVEDVSDYSDNALCVRSASTININSGSYYSAGDYAVSVSNAGAQINIKDGSFASEGMTKSDQTVFISYGTVNTSGGAFAGYINSANKTTGDSVASLAGGTYGTPDGRADVADGYCMLKLDSRYEVLPKNEAMPYAYWVVTDTDGNKVYYTDETSARADFTALGEAGKYVRQLFRVRFYSKGVRVELRYIEDGDALGELSTPTYEGLTFDGWFDGDTKASAEASVTSNLSFSAKWSEPAPEPDPETYVVTFDSRGGTYVGFQEVESGKTATEPTPAPTLTGYTFKGWMLDDAAYAFSTPVKSNITLVATWEKDSEPEPTYHTVTFMSEGKKLDTQQVEDGKCAVKPSNPIRPGYSFSGWKLGGADYTFTEKVTTDITLVASWTEDVKPATYTVTFDSDGGTAIDALEVVQGQAAVEPGAPTKEGFLFRYWEKDGEAYDFSTPVVSNLELKAVWGTAVAEYNGVSYLSLQDAIAAVDPNADGATVKLLKDSCEAVHVDGLTNLTIDLNGKTLSNVEGFASVLSATGCSGLTIKGGGVVVNDVADDSETDGIVLVDCDGFTLEDVAAEVKDGLGKALAVSKTDDGQTSGTIKGGSYVSSHSVAARLDGGDFIIESGSFASKSAAAVLCENSTLTVAGGTFTAKGDQDDDAPALVLNGTVATVNAGAFDHPVKVDDTSDLTVNGGQFTYIDSSDAETARLLINDGTFDEPDNYAYVVEDKALFKAKGGKYTVKAEDEAWNACKAWVVLGDDAIYCEDKDEAKKAVKGIDLDFHEVQFVSMEKLVKTAYVLDSSALGRVPAGEQVAGYTFAGWFDGDKAKGAGFVPTDDVTLVAMWTKDGSDDSDPVVPDGKDTSDDKGGTSDKKSDAAVDEDEERSSEANGAKAGSTADAQGLAGTGDPVSAAAGIAATGAAFAAVGVFRRRK